MFISDEYMHVFNISADMINIWRQMELLKDKNPLKHVSMSHYSMEDYVISQKFYINNNCVHN